MLLTQQHAAAVHAVDAAACSCRPAQVHNWHGGRLDRDAVSCVMNYATDYPSLFRGRHSSSDAFKGGHIKLPLLLLLQVLLQCTAWPDAVAPPWLSTDQRAAAGTSTSSAHSSKRSALHCSNSLLRCSAGLCLQDWRSGPGLLPG